MTGTGPDPAALGATIAAWYRVSRRELPWRAPGFGAWGVLVSEVMLQQTPVARVIRPGLLAAAWPSLGARLLAVEAVRAGRLGYPQRAL